MTLRNPSFLACIFAKKGNDALREGLSVGQDLGEPNKGRLYVS